MAATTPRRSAALQSALISDISQGKVSPQDAEHVLTAAFMAEDYSNCIKDLRRCGVDPQAYIDGLDRIIGTLSPTSEIHRSGLLALQKACGIYRLLPPSCIKPEPLTLITTGSMKRPFASGGFSDLWKARDANGWAFAVKQFRVHMADGLERVKKKFCKGIPIWKRIKHENVLSIEGAAPALFEVCMVSKWMDNGNMLQYVRSHQGVNRMRLLIGITRGLHHLHSNGVVHGKLKGSNILIDQQGNPLIADFGLSSIMIASASVDPESTPPLAGGTVRWSAPELLHGLSDKSKSQTPTTKSDIYALSMVVVELYSGDIPFHDRPDSTVILMVSRGERPPKPASAEVLGLTPAVWKLTKECWQKKAAKRPNTSEILARLLERRTSPSLFGWVGGLGKSRPTERRPIATASRIGTQQQQREEIFPQTPSFSEVMRDLDPETQRNIDGMDNRLWNYILPDQERQRLFNELCKTCSRYRMVPTSMYMPDCLQGAIEAAHGGSATVWQNMYNGVCVAVKVFNIYPTSNVDDLLSRFCREGVAWRHLRHSNVLPLLGVTIREHQLAMVSEWMDNGNINQFIGKDQLFNRPMLLIDVANGLVYLHDLRIVHGDLKGANILINKGKRACIADFGLLTITGVATGAGARISQVSLASIGSLMPFTPGGTFRWMSPELLDPESFGVPHSEEMYRPTTLSDCYAFGMVTYEVLCGHRPYVEIESDILVIPAIVRGVRPKKPEGEGHLGFTEDLWRILEQCWLEDYSARPSVEDILPYLNDAALHWDTATTPGNNGSRPISAQAQDRTQLSAQPSFPLTGARGSRNQEPDDPPNFLSQ